MWLTRGHTPYLQIKLNHRAATSACWYNGAVNTIQHAGSTVQTGNDLYLCHFNEGYLSVV